MTGTGTQADPYIVGNEEEFREAVNQFGAHVECTEGMIFDYEDRQEDVPIFTVRAREVRCNGLTVKNGRFDHAIIEVIRYTDGVGGGGRNEFSFYDINIEDNIFTTGTPLFWSPYHSDHYGDVVINFHRSEIKQKINSPIKKAGVNNDRFYVNFFSSNITLKRLPEAGSSLTDRVYFTDCNIFLYDDENTGCPFVFNNSHYNYISGRFNLNIGNSLLAGCTDLIFDLETKKDGTKYIFHSSQWIPNTKSVVYNSDVITESHSNTASPDYTPTGLSAEELWNLSKLAAAGIAIDPAG